MSYYKFRANKFDEKSSKYRDIDTLLSDRLFASAFVDLNDPFEATYEDLIQSSLRLIERFFDISANEVRKQWDNLQSFSKKLGIYSLVQTSGIPDNELMWSFYADSHKGFCIEYDIDKLMMSEPNEKNVNRIPVNYRLLPPRITIADISSPDAMITKLFATKSKRWKYENEIRLIYNSAGIKKYYPQSLKSVYFGCKMDPVFQNQIIQGLAGKDVSFYKMERRSGTYQLQACLIRQNRRDYPIHFSDSDYQLLSYSKNNVVENFHVYYKGSNTDKESLLEFAKWYRFKNAIKKQSSVFLYDSPSIRHLINKYPLTEKEEREMARHNIAESNFNFPDELIMHPLL